MNFLKLNDGWLFVNPQAIAKVEKGQNQLILVLTDGSKHTVTNPDDIKAVLSVVSPKPQAPEPVYLNETAGKAVKKAGK